VVTEQDKTNQRNEISLIDMYEGNKGIFVKICCGKHFTADRLRNLGITLGKEIKIISKQPCGPIIIEIDQSKIAIGRKIASKIYVKEI